MACGTAIATINHIRGETIRFALRSDPAYNGTETVTCVVKLAVNKVEVPPASAPVVYTITPVFVPGSDAYWQFEIPPSQTEMMTPAHYITDAKIVYYGTGEVDKPLPLAICLAEAVTA